MIRHVPAHGTAHGTVVLLRPAPRGGVVVVLEALDPGVVAVPATVALAEGYIGQAFPITWIAIGTTTIRAELDGVEALLDVAAPGVLPAFHPEGAVVARALEPEATVAGDERARPEATVARTLRPAGDGVEDPPAELLPRPQVARTLRPRPVRAGEE